MAKAKAQLHGLLNSLERCHKNDIQDFTSGHLNESKSHRKLEISNRKSWAAARKEPIVMLEKHNFVKSPPRSMAGKESKMSDVLYDFTMGTSGTLPNVTNKPGPSQRFQPTTTPSSRQQEVQTRSSLHSHLAEDGVYIEELRPQELLLPTPRSQWTPATFTPRTFSKGHAKSVETPSRYNTPISHTHYTNKDLTTSEHIAVLSYYCGATKKDQYNKLKDFQSSILKTKDSTEKNVLSGTKAVDHLQKRLEEELSSLHFSGVGPNFHKLQVYSNTFDSLVDNSPTFKYILSCIKNEYDSYIGQLLDGQTSQHRLLQDQVERMTNRGTSRPNELQRERDRLAGLEDEARDVLEENDRLRSELEMELKLKESAPSESAEGKSPSHRMFKKDPPMELADEVEHVKALILEKLDELNTLRGNLRAEYVPSTVCTHLEQCIKESEVDVQKLLKQNEYFEKSIDDLQNELKEAIVTADTSERDARRIWRRVNSTRQLGSSRSSTTYRKTTNTQETLYESEDEDDESKWNWYIS